MKIVNYKSGLGNQVFYYLLCLYLQDKHPKERIYGFYNPKWLKKHSGMELDYAFDVVLPPQTIWSKIVTNYARIASKIIRNLRVTDTCFSEDALYYDGWWQDKKFFLKNIEKIRFRERPLGEMNMNLLGMIHNSSSVSIHIRRGDYLDPENQKQYGGICTLDYYKKAMDIIKERIKDPKFFVFSNDITWVKVNMDIPNPIYVDNNKGKNSYMDMFLMSRCKANILANSSFSYWGAMLNVNNPQLVVYPQKWFNSHTPDIFPGKWEGI